MIKNFGSIKKLIAFIIYILEKDYKIPKWDYNRLLTHFKKIPEKGVEIFQRPDITYYRLLGDCDDWTTMIIKIAQKRGDDFKIVFKIKNNSAVHVYPIVKRGESWFTLDPWQSTTPIPFVKKADDKVVEVCFLFEGKCVKF